jgi:hypothetical protein
MVDLLLDGDADVVRGARSFSGDMPWLYRFGNTTLNWILLVLFGLRLSDSQCGLLAFRASLYDKIRWAADDYALESEICVRVARARLHHAEVPIPAIYHERYKGTQPTDGLRILAQLVLWRFRLPQPPRRSTQAANELVENQ